MAEEEDECWKLTDTAIDYILGPLVAVYVWSRNTTPPLHIFTSIIVGIPTLLLFYLLLTIIICPYVLWLIIDHIVASSEPLLSYLRREQASQGNRASASVDVENGTSSLGLDPTIMAILPKTTYTDEKTTSQTENCEICKLVVKGGEEVRILPSCMHMFHVGCIDQWLLSNHICCTCKEKVRLPPAVFTGSDDGGGPTNPAPDE